MLKNTENLVNILATVKELKDTAKKCLSSVNDNNWIYDFYAGELVAYTVLENLIQDAFIAYSTKQLKATPDYQESISV